MLIHGDARGGSKSRINEDTWGSVTFPDGGLAWVLDGATQPAETVSEMSAQEFVEKLSQEIAKAATDNGTLEIKQIVQTALEETTKKWKNGIGPAATIAAVKWDSKRTQWFILGDSAVIYQKDNQVNYRSDNRLYEIAVEERKAMLALNSSNTHEEIRQVKMDLYHVERGARNTPEGYWVLADDLDAVNHAITGTADPGATIIIGTDGFFDGVKAGSAWVNSTEAYHQLCSSKNAEEAISKVHNVLADQTPKPSKIDDAAVVIIETK